ncbi:MAG: FHA domain-containing protein [Candidatus Competibacteraceae bacterium]
MARVRVCPTCGVENSLTDIRCARCGVSLARVSPTEAAPPESEPVVATGAESATLSCPQCEAAISPDRTSCPYCGESLPAGPRIVLEWPWGAQTLDGELIVGRDPDASPLADRLAGYGNLSRRHFRLRPAAEGLWIEDLGSTNGVFVDENRLTPRQPFLLAESGRLRLARDFVVVVRVER